MQKDVLKQLMITYTMPDIPLIEKKKFIKIFTSAEFKIYQRAFFSETDQTTKK